MLAQTPPPPSHCGALTSAEEGKIKEYLVKQYHLGAPEDTVLVDASAIDLCYWKLKFQSGKPARSFLMYLAPDHKYITPSLLDLSVDPVLAQKRAEEAIQQQLVHGNPPSLGPKQPALTITEFSDFECPYCKRFSDMLSQARQTPEMTDVKVIFRQYPLTSIHPWAEYAAEAQSCAALQSPEAFWAMSEQIFAQQQSLSPPVIHEKLDAIALKTQGLDQAAYHMCILTGQGRQVVSDDVKLGQTLGVQGTPTLFLNGRRIAGVRDENELIAVVREAKGLAPKAASTTASVAAPVAASAACLPASR